MTMANSNAMLLALVAFALIGSSVPPPPITQKSARVTNDCVRGAEIVPRIVPDARINAGSVRALDSARRPRQEAAAPAVSAAPAGHTSAMPPQRTLLKLEQNTFALLEQR